MASPPSQKHAQITTLIKDHDGWELSEGDLPEGSNLSCSKALEEYPEDEANSRKNKKTNPGKRKNGHPKSKA